MGTNLWMPHFSLGKGWEHGLCWLALISHHRIHEDTKLELSRVGHPFDSSAPKSLSGTRKAQYGFPHGNKKQKQCSRESKEKDSVPIYVYYRACWYIAGGLAIMWDEEVKVEVEGSTGELINVKCTDLHRGDLMRISFLHASTKFQERLRHWRDVKNSNYLSPLPWLCIGDFNEILYHWEKVGCREVDRYRIAAFRSFIDDCSLMDIESKGCTYTWANNRE